jgi:TRAP-type C4-dicarboxylate transport system substrate-binding protein
MKKTVILPLVFIVTIGLFFCVTVQAKTIKLRVGHDLPPFTAPGIAYQAFADEVNKNAAGRVEVEVFPARSLGEQASALEMVNSGVADAYHISLSSHRSHFPITNVDALPGHSFPTTPEGYLAHAKALSSLIEKYPVVANEFKNYQLLCDLINPTNLMMSANKLIRVPEDLKGLKVGGTGVKLDLFKACGAAGVFKVLPKSYQALQTGVIDAAALHWTGLGEFKLYEVIKYVLEIPIDQSSLAFLMSKRSWNKLSAEDQKIVMAAAEKAAMIEYKLISERAADGIQKFKAFGKDRVITVPTASETKLWEEKFQPLRDKWVADRESQGVKNAREILDYYKSLVDKAWGK